MQILAREFKQHDTLIKHHNGCDLTLHSVEVVPMCSDSAEGSVPLVFLPGYGTGAAIFAQCWAHLLDLEDGLCSEMPLIGLDLLGFFLSSHPKWTPGTDAERAEAWFVESLEAWRSARGIEQMDLLGHSIGGNVAAVYAESYPSHVRKLILVSPAGMIGEPDDYQQKLRNASRRVRLAMALWRRGWNPFTALRLLPQKYAYRICTWNARRWSGNQAQDEGLSVADPVALADYIYHGWREGPASAEGAIAALLHPGAWGKKPLSQRLPQIPVTRIEMIYGVRDWMDMRHGNRVAEACSEQRSSEMRPRTVCVQVVDRAGHYAHLENVAGFVQALSRAIAPRQEAETLVAATVPEGYADRFSGPRVPAWRNWEGYDFGR